MRGQAHGLTRYYVCPECLDCGVLTVLDPPDSYTCLKCKCSVEKVHPDLFWFIEAVRGDLKAPWGQGSEGMSETTAEALKTVIEEACMRIPGMRINWKEGDGPAEYYSEATLERAVTFLQELFDYSTKKGDPIDVPGIYPSSGGDIKLEGSFGQYRFLFCIPADPASPVVYAGLEKDGGRCTRGTLQLCDVGKAFEQWQVVRRGKDDSGRGGGVE